MRSTKRTPIAIGVDIGSTNTKVIAMDAAGAVVARGARRTPRDVEGLCIDPDALLRTIDELIVSVCAAQFEVHSVCTVGVGEDGLLVDRELAPVSEALPWFDPRRQAIFQRLRADLHDDDEFDTETDPARTLVGWWWSRTQSMRQVAGSTWVAIADLAGVAWSGVPYVSETLASRTAAWRSSDRRWSCERIELTLGSEDQLPPVVRSGTVVGCLRSERIRAAGVLAPDPVMVAGGHDHPIGGWAVGQLVSGAILDSMGTAEVIVAQSSRTGQPRRLQVDRAPGIQPNDTIFLRVEELSRNVEWASQDPDVAQRIREILAGKLRPDQVLDHAYFIPGVRGGGRPSYSPDAPRDPRARASAVLGALAYAGKIAVDAVGAQVSGERIMRLAGGWVRSPGWVDIKAAVNGFHAVPLLEPEVTAVGAALLAARGRGWQPDPAHAFDGSSVKIARNG